MLQQTNRPTEPLTYQDKTAVQSERRFYRTYTHHFVTPLPQPSVSVFPDGTLIAGWRAFPTLDAKRDRIRDRLIDLQLVLDEMVRMNSFDPIVGGRLDLDHVGAYGGNIGGATAAELCRVDNRCKCSVNMDGRFSMAQARAVGGLSRSDRVFEEVTSSRCCVACRAGFPNPKSKDIAVLQRLPEGVLRIAWQFTAGFEFAITGVPKGRVNDLDGDESAVPSGLVRFWLPTQR